MPENESDADKMKRLVAAWLQDKFVPSMFDVENEGRDLYEWMCHHLSLVSDRDLEKIIRHPKADSFRVDYAMPELASRVHLKQEHWTITPTFCLVIVSIIIAILAWLFPRPQPPSPDGSKPPVEAPSEQLQPPKSEGPPPAAPVSDGAAKLRSPQVAPTAETPKSQTPAQSPAREEAKK